ncbi:hypothetical protein FRC05_005238 [Tulasnella sp. 425]|nr:hypothetical protein FRC05_005238 [Tulasnella sp. 425]
MAPQLINRTPTAQSMERMTSIQDLPIELLVYIFRLSFDITSLQRDRCRLGLVCHSWRDLVQKSPSLWTEISAHDNIHYIETSLTRSKDLPIDIYYLLSDGPVPRIRLISYIEQVTPLLSRSRSISVITLSSINNLLKRLLVELQSNPALLLESLILKGWPMPRWSFAAEADPPWQLSEISAFPKLRRLEIEGICCKLSPPGLQLHNVLSLNLVDIVNVSAEQLLDVLQNSPYLETLGLGQSPVACPAHTALSPIHLPHLTTLRLVLMPIHVSNFFLSTIHAPNCSELDISSDFRGLPDDVVNGSLFTSSTNHFTPVLRTLLTRGRYKDIDITSTSAGNIRFLLQFHDSDRKGPVSLAVLQLDFTLNSARQIEETVRWLGNCLQRDGPKISIRLRMKRFEDVHIMDLLDSYTTITHLGFRAASLPDPTISNSILLRMAHPTQLGWPLTNLEVFVYAAAEDAESQDEAMLDMLRRRYTSSSEGLGNEGIRPRPIKRVRVCLDDSRSDYIIGEVQKILPEVETPWPEDHRGIW